MNHFGADRSPFERLDRDAQNPAGWLHLVRDFGGIDAVGAQDRRDRGFQRSPIDSV
jgi:hypothetical protein